MTRLQAADLGPCLATVSAGCLDENCFCVYRVRSEFQSGETLIRVLLPQKYDGNERLRVLFLLPVEAGTEHRYGDGLLEAKRLDLHNKHRLICVAPTFAQLPWYADHPTDKSIRQESYLVKVVVPTVERLYPTVAERDGRLLVGFSKSGFGAWTLLLRNPQLFAKAAAWDAPLMKAAPDQFGMGPIYGTAENFEHYRIDRLLRERIAELQWQTDQPSKKENDSRNERSNARLIHLGYGNFHDHHQSTEALLGELRIPHVYADGPRREHTWHSGWLNEAVRKLAE